MCVCIRLRYSFVGYSTLFYIALCEQKYNNPWKRVIMQFKLALQPLKKERGHLDCSIKNIYNIYLCILFINAIWFMTIVRNCSSHVSAWYKSFFSYYRKVFCSLDASHRLFILVPAREGVEHRGTKEVRRMLIRILWFIDGTSAGGALGVVRRACQYP